MLFLNRLGSQFEVHRFCATFCATFGLLVCVAISAAQAAPKTNTASATDTAKPASTASDTFETTGWKNEDFPIQAVFTQMGWKGGAIAADQWKPDEQPNLAQELLEAKPLTFVDIVSGPQSVNNGQRPYLVPNADGTWDMVFPYFGKYYSPQEMVIHDFGTGETRSEWLGNRKDDSLLARESWEFHMEASYYSNGKLVLANGGDKPVLFAIYDPQKNAFTHAVKPFGDKVIRSRSVLGDDEKIYGIGWDKGRNDGFIAFWYDPKTEQSWHSEPFGQVNKNLKSLYGGTVMSGDWLYADHGSEPWQLVGFNFKTGESRVLATSQNIIGSYKTIRYVPIEGGLSGVIEHPATINGGDKVADETLLFWVHEGKLIPRTAKDENTPWSGKPAVNISRPSFDWDRENQHWPKDFKPQEMTPKQLTANAVDVLVMASDATLSVTDATKPGWKKMEGEPQYGGVAYLNEGSADQPSAHNGVATVTVRFTEPGAYYLYFRGRSMGARTNAGLAFSQGDGDEHTSPFASTAVDNFSRTSDEFVWIKAFQSLHNDNSFIYNVKQEDVGKSLAFKVATGYTGAYKNFSGVAWDALLFSKESNKAMGLVPLIEKKSDSSDMYGHATLPYRFQNGPELTLKYDVTLRDTAIRDLLEINDHVLFALPDLYGQQVFYNLKTRQAMRFEAASSPYSMGLAGDRLYVSGYPGSLLFEYVFAGKDGQPLSRAERTKVAQIDKVNTTHAPIAGTLSGADGGVYNAGITYGRQRDGGGFGWYDPKTGKIDGMPLPQRLFWSTTADNGRYIIFSTKPGATDENLQLLGWDTTTHKLIYQENVPEFGAAGPLVEALPGGLVMGHATAKDHGYLYGLHAATGKVLWRKEVPDKPNTAFSLIRRHRYTFRRGPEGDIWAFMGNVLVRIDPRTAHVTVVGKLPENELPAQIAFAQGNVYIAWSGLLRQIQGLHTSQVQAPAK